MENQIVESITDTSGKEYFIADKESRDNIIAIKEDLTKMNDSLFVNAVKDEIIELPEKNTGYISSSGKLSSATETAYGNYAFNVKKGDKFLISGVHYRYICLYVCIYNDDTKVNSGYDGTTTVYFDTDVVFEAEKDGILYVNAYKEYEVSVKQYAAKAIEFRYLEQIQQFDKDIKKLNDSLSDIGSASNILSGKKWAVCGDSFSHGDFNNALTSDNTITEGKYKGQNKVYGYIIGNRNNMEIQHLSKGGRTMGLPSDGTFTNSFVNYYQRIDEDVDYITLYFGINDYHHKVGSSGTDNEDTTGVIPLGTVDDMTTDTFCGAYNVVLKWLIENRPYAHIGVIVTNGLTSTTDYRDMTIAIAKKYGVPYLDLNGDERTPSMHRTCNPDISSAAKDILLKKWAVNPSLNTHPNAKAHEFESYFIENFLKSI